LTSILALASRMVRRSSRWRSSRGWPRRQVTRRAISSRYRLSTLGKGAGSNPLRPPARRCAARRPSAVWGVRTVGRRRSPHREHRSACEQCGPGGVAGRHTLGGGFGVSGGQTVVVCQRSASEALNRQACAEGRQTSCDKRCGSCEISRPSTILSNSAQRTRQRPSDGGRANRRLARGRGRGCVGAVSGQVPGSAAAGGGDRGGAVGDGAAAYPCLLDPDSGGRRRVSGRA
jgi:hypothetical protein